MCTVEYEHHDMPETLDFGWTKKTNLTEEDGKRLFDNTVNETKKLVKAWFVKEGINESDVRYQERCYDWTYDDAQAHGVTFELEWSEWNDYYEEYNDSYVTITYDSRNW